MKITSEMIVSYRMQVCVSCKQTGDNIFSDKEVCHSSADEIDACIDANLYSMEDQYK